MFSLAGALNLQGTVLAVSLASGNAAVAQFVTHRAAASLTTYVGSLLRPALWTEMTFLSARSDTARLQSVVSVAVRISACCAALAGSALCVVAPFGYALWTRSELILDVPLLAILVGQAVLSASWSAASWPLLSANRPRVLARWSILNGVLTVLGAYGSLRLGWELRGVAAASLCADIVCGLIPIPMAAAAFLQVSSWRFARDLARALICATPVAAAAYFSVRYLESDAWRLASFAGACLLLAWPVLVGLLGSSDLARIRATLLKR
jgi:O-antigen/teichoic acid export membrane protein